MTTRESFQRPMLFSSWLSRTSIIQKIPNAVCDAEGIYVMHSVFKTIFRNVEQNLQSCRLHHWANHEFTVAVIPSSQRGSNPFRGIVLPF